LNLHFSFFLFVSPLDSEDSTGMDPKFQAMIARRRAGISYNTPFEVWTHGVCCVFRVQLITSACIVVRPPSACDVEQDWDGGESAGTSGTGTTISSPPTDIGKT
jgi:hypothetical protein